jgi:hypothetical protein
VRVLPDSCISRVIVRMPDFSMFLKNIAATFLDNFLLKFLIFARPIILSNKLLKNIATLSVMQNRSDIFECAFLSLEIACLFLP